MMEDVPQDVTPAPHDRCNWLIPGRLLAGCLPDDAKLDALLRAGVTHFVCLNKTVVYQVPPHVHVEHYPIDIGATGKPDEVESLCLKILAWVSDESEKACVYLHCAGGNGRTGMIGAIVSGWYYGWGLCRAIDHVNVMRKQRADRSMNFVPSPETPAQVDFLTHFLKLEEGCALPDRSDTSWFQKLKPSDDMRADELPPDATVNDVYHSALYDVAAVRP